MTYEIGQKVETPLGDGEIKKIETWSDGHNQFVVYIKGIFVTLSSSQLKPYKTPQERLLELGLKLKIKQNWYGDVFSHEWWNDDDIKVLVFYVYEKQFSVYEASNEIARIIPDYLEWLEVRNE